MLLIKKYLFCSAILLSINPICAAELQDGCEPAVDAADRLNSNTNKNCDYSNTGLNGVLHRALSKKNEAGAETVIEKEPSKALSKEQGNKEPADKEKTVGMNSSTISSSKKDLAYTLKGEFSSAQQLASVRYELVRKATQECVKGFAIDGEHYLPVSAELMKLELSFHCL